MEAVVVPVQDSYMDLVEVVVHHFKEQQVEEEEEEETMALLTKEVEEHLQKMAEHLVEEQEEISMVMLNFHP